MTGLEILKYCSFGYSLVLAIIIYGLSVEIITPRIFKICFVAAIISGGFGIIMELTDLYGLDKGLTLVIMLIPLIVLSNLELFRLIFKKWKGTEPAHVFGGVNKIGDKVSDGRWTKYPVGRVVMMSDFFFSNLSAIVPFLEIVGLLILTIIINK